MSYEHCRQSLETVQSDIPVCMFRSCLKSKNKFLNKYTPTNKIRETTINSLVDVSPRKEKKEHRENGRVKPYFGRSEQATTPGFTTHTLCTPGGVHTNYSFLPQ